MEVLNRATDPNRESVIFLFFKFRESGWLRESNTETWKALVVFGLDRNLVSV